jgi:hypothetical protein
MITLEKLNAEIKSIESTEPKAIAAMTKRELNSMNARVIFLRFVKSYLLTDPQEKFVASEIKRLENRINALDKVYEDLPKPKDETQFLKDYQKDNDYSHLNQQLKVLRFILQ